MITTGVDIEEISRFKDKSEKFLSRIFTPEEIKYCFQYKNPAPHLAARYCAKEAIVKAMSDLYPKLIPYSKIEIIKKRTGAPRVNILIEELKNRKIALSVSHDRQKAIAFVVVY